MEKIFHVSVSTLTPDVNSASTYTQDDDEEEVDVGDVVELIVQVFRDKADRGILGRPNLVSRVVMQWPAFVVPLGSR